MRTIRSFGTFLLIAFLVMGWTSWEVVGGPESPSEKKTEDKIQDEEIQLKILKSGDASPDLDPAAEKREPETKKGVRAGLDSPEEQERFNRFIQELRQLYDVEPNIKY